MISSPNISQNACGHDMCCHGIPRSSVFDYSGSVKCPGRCSCSCSCCLRKQTNVLVPAEHLSALRQLMFLGSGFGLFFTAVCGLTILYPHKLSRAWWKKNMFLSTKTIKDEQYVWKKQHLLNYATLLVPVSYDRYFASRHHISLS